MSKAWFSDQTIENMKSVAKVALFVGVCAAFSYAIRNEIIGVVEEAVEEGAEQAAQPVQDFQISTTPFEE